MALCRAMGAKEVQEELLLPLIQAVRDRLAGALKEVTAPEDCGPAFLLAAAMTVMDWLEDLEGGTLNIRIEGGSVDVPLDGLVLAESVK